MELNGLLDIELSVPEPTELADFWERRGIESHIDDRDFVPNVDILSIDCGHWIQQEKPEETNRMILNWLERQAQ